ncbi:MAG: FHA domain-containing protein [Lachnospiraceae bacterium]|nr:FHA domain-containing protein [Lachnospiraceae bacterium]
MNLVRCNQGHYYDSDKYASCPHCNGMMANNDVTVGIVPNAEEDAVTEALTESYAQTVLPESNVVQQSAPVSDLAAAVQQATVGADTVSEDDDKTVSYYEGDFEKGVDPVVGWLVCVEGKNKGKDYRLKAGRNFIGRSANMDVRIADDSSVSRDRHAIVVYEPKQHMFLLQPGESKELSYLNGNVILTPVPVQKNDILTVGDTKLMFFPCCDETFNWDNY